MGMLMLKVTFVHVPVLVWHLNFVPCYVITPLISR